MLSFAYKNWDGRVPQAGELRPDDRAILAEVEGGFKLVGESFEAVRLRAALNSAMGLASAVNRYLDQAAPWFEIKEDKAQAAKTIYTALRAIDSLKVLLAPTLPFTSERLHQFLGYPGTLFGTQYVETVSDELGEHQVLRYRPDQGEGKWEASRLPEGQFLREPQALFRKLEPSIVEEERGRLGS